MRENTPRIINCKCLMLHLSLLALFFFIQLLPVECWLITHRSFLKFYLILNSILMLVAFGYLMYRVSNIKAVLIKDFDYYLKSFLKKSDYEKKLNGWLKSLETNLPAYNQHNQFLRRYFVCFLFVIIGFACVYQMLYLIDKTSYSCNSLLGSSIGKMLNFLYFSFVTITTSSYGDMMPASFLAKLVATLEITTGIIFLVVLLDIYFASKEEIKDIFKDVLKHANLIIAQEISRTNQEIGETKKKGKKLKSAQEQMGGWAKDDG
jgi:hypothetical protein